MTGGTQLAAQMSETTLVTPVGRLTQAYFRTYPRDAARKLESLLPADAADILVSQPPVLRQRVWHYMSLSAASQILVLLPDPVALELLAALGAGPCASLISRFDAAQRDHYLSFMTEAQGRELRELLDYPSNSAGHMMDAGVVTFGLDVTAAEAMTQLVRYPAAMRRRVYLVDSSLRLYGQVDLVDLVAAEPGLLLVALSRPVDIFVAALDPKEDVAEKLQKHAIDSVPVVDINHHLLGVIRGANAIEALKENIAADLQTMVGASAEERALSSSFFAVRKRQPWLQINLLTGFLAASVVSFFEGTIAQITALAILMPIAAGQSGNTGAQALAVTMRGITLREITVRDWFRVMFKEAGAGFINGVVVALTCCAGVYLWSGSLWLALVLAMAMIISMTIAGIAGALVPICLKKLGQDPAQSSSIILTTVTDIAGFMSFLGIATVLSSKLL